MEHQVAGSIHIFAPNVALSPLLDASQMQFLLFPWRVPVNADEAAHTQTDTHAPLKLGVSSDG